MIDYTELTTEKPNVKYESGDLEAGGYKLRFALDELNPLFSDVLNRCKEQGLAYELRNGDDKQKHIWIIGWSE